VQFGAAHETVAQKSTGWQIGQQARSDLTGVVPVGHGAQLAAVFASHGGLYSQ